MRCSYCHNEGAAKAPIQFIPREEIIVYARIFYRLGVRKYKIIGGEPTLREDIALLIRGIRDISPELDISIITNGTRIKALAPYYADAGISRINVSLHGWPEQGHGISCIPRPHEQTKDAILYLKRIGLLSKVNFVLLKDKNEQALLEVVEWAGKHGLLLDVLNVLYPPESQEWGVPLHYEFDQIRDLLVANFPVIQERIVKPEIGLQSTQISLANSAIINLKTTKLNQCMPFSSCRNCHVFDYCVEGINAIRLTENGMIQPCLFRRDNMLDLHAIYTKEGERGAEAALVDFLHWL